MRQALAHPEGPPAGFQGVYILVDRATGKHLAVSLWATREDAEAAGARAAELGSQLMAAFGAAGRPTDEIYEVAIRA